MNTKEGLIWEKLNNIREASLDEEWLGQIYSPKLSIDLRRAIAEKLGLLAEDGWRVIKSLVKKHGAQSELIHAAGISHQLKAKEWLLKELQRKKSLNIEILQALAIGGTCLPTKLLKKILNKPEQAFRLTGLELLKFKIHELSNEQLINLTKHLLNDFRDPIVINTIKILQRRDGLEICSTLGDLASNDNNNVAHAALMGLGSIGSKESRNILFLIARKLPKGDLKDLANKQLRFQYEFTNQ